MDNIYWIIVACAIGTYLTRLLPLYIKPIKQETQLQRTINAMLLALGPAAIIALLIVSIWPLLHIDALSLQPIAVIIGLAGVWITHRLWRGIAIPTLIGVLCYGTVLWLIQL